MKPDGAVPALEAIGLDPDVILLREAGLLLDARFVSALHAEIEEQVGSRAAPGVLLQIGFLNGLRDAYRAVDEAFAPGAPSGSPFSTPALAIRFRVRRDAGPPGAIEVRGEWPERNEAAARLGRQGRRCGASCHVSAGYTSGWLSAALEADLLALETGCAATGAESCHFVAREAPAWRADGDRRATAALAAIDFDAFRAFARQAAAAPDHEPPRSEAAMDREAAVVHIWGPVMVIPYAGPDEALQAVELIGSDPSARDVSVIVVDLGGAVLDEAFGALSLERIVETAETWGAETILAGVSPLSERVVADLARPPLIVQKDLDAAIALAFQIARSQRASQ